MRTIEILGDLIGFDTTSRNPNRELMAYVESLLAEYGIASTLIPNADGSKQNLYATVGPAQLSGVMLSGHTDVVPVDGQVWTRPAFQLTQDNGRCYGRGTTDMKGFIASALGAMIDASRRSLKTPLHLALSYDEEIGCVGVHSLLDMLSASPVKPSMCLVGEPTELNVATMHKGKTALKATCTGKEGHSALAPNAMNAIHLGCDLVQAIRDTQVQLVDAYGIVEPHDVPYTTLHVGLIDGGKALNIVPNLCELSFEIRNTSKDDPETILASIKQTADSIARTTGVAEASIEIVTTNTYPGLDTAVDESVVKLAQSLVDADVTTQVAFGTEGGLFSRDLGIPTVVCGPGSMEQGHKPDEYIEQAQLEQCDKMLAGLVDKLAQGL